MATVETTALFKSFQLYLTCSLFCWGLCTALVAKLLGISRNVYSQLLSALENGVANLSEIELGMVKRTHVCPQESSQEPLLLVEHAYSRFRVPHKADLLNTDAGRISQLNNTETCMPAITRSMNRTRSSGLHHSSVPPDTLVELPPLTQVS